MSASAEPIAESASMQEVLATAARVAATDATVLLTGESGVGKERIARFLHERSHRRPGPFVAINCGALAETLLESELFGHVRGSFTGASADKKGLFEAAAGGTLFLDEIGETTPAAQVRLLRTLQERTVRPVGSTRDRPVDVRIVAATNRDLLSLVREKAFRRDLFYRLRVIPLYVPPLRERRKDVLALAADILRRLCVAHRRAPATLAADAVERLLAYAWPGNVRELENAMERAVLLAGEDAPIRAAALPPEVRGEADDTTAFVEPAAAHSVLTLAEVERRHILAMLDRFGGSRRETASALGIAENTLWRKLREYGVLRPRGRRPAVRRTNLEAAAAPLVGRRGDLAAVLGKLASARLVTLTGMGGVGKSRLALEVGRSWFAEEDARTAWIADLHGAADLDSLCETVGRALALPLAGSSATRAVGQIAGSLAERGPVLVILDGFDRLVPLARESLAIWLSAAPDARFLVTSREALRKAGTESPGLSEVTHLLGPLHVPAGRAGADERAPSCEAVQLFLERATAARGGLPPPATDPRTLLGLVRRLDGLPLAIELAAARASVLSPAQILERLDRRLDLAGTRGTRGKRGSLEDVMAGSWSVLTKPERDTLSEVSVFRGGFTMDAAESVVHEPATVLDALEGLRDKSLLRLSDSEAGERRFDLAGVVREYAGARLADSGREEETLDRHAQWCLRAAAAAEASKSGVERLRRLAAEQQNLVAVVRRALAMDPPGPDELARAADALLALDAVVAVRGPFEPHLAMLDEALTRAESAGQRSLSPGRLAGLLRARAEARRTHGAVRAGLADLERARELVAVPPADEARECVVLISLASALTDSGRATEAEASLERALFLARKNARRAQEGIALSRQVVIHQERGRMREAEESALLALPLLRETGERWHEQITVHNLALALFHAGRLDEASSRFAHALALAREVGDRRVEGVVLGNSARLFQETGAHDEARARFERALELHRECGNRRFEGTTTAWSASLLQELGRNDEADVLHRRSLEMLREVGDRRYATLVTALLGVTRASLDDLPGARRLLEEAEEELRGTPLEAARAALEIHRGHLDLAEARLSARGGALSLEPIERAATRLRAPGASSIDVRLAQRLLASALDRTDAS